VGRNSYTTKIPTSRSWEAAPLSQRFPACPCSFCWLVSTLCSFRRLSSLTPPPLRRCLFRYSPPVCWSPPLLVAPQGRPYHPPHILFQSPSRHVIVSEWIHTKSWRAEAPSAKAAEKKLRQPRSLRKELSRSSSPPPKEQIELRRSHTGGNGAQESSSADILPPLWSWWLCGKYSSQEEYRVKVNPNGRQF
jgi:hypothetical protein